MRKPKRLIGYLGGIGRALSASNYRRYWYGHVFSANGVWIFLISSQWLTFHLTQSPIWLGAVGFSYLAPLFVLGPLAGAVADRYGHRRTAIISLSLGILVTILTAAAILTKVMTPLLLVLLTIVQGAFMSFDFPARQAVIPQLIERANLSAAIGMNTTTFHTAGFVGPVIGAALLSWGNDVLGQPGGAALAYLATAFAFSMMVYGLTRVKIITPLPMKDRSGPLATSILADIRAGLGYILSSSQLKMIMLLSIAMAICLRSYQNLMAGLADSVFGLDERGLGSLLAASGVGALTVALLFSIRGKIEGLTRIFVLGAAVTAIALLVLISNTNLTTALFSLAFAGGALVGASLSAQTLIQHMVLDEYRARVISVSVAISVGGPAFGTLLIGWVAEMVGFRWALFGAAGLVLIILLLIGRRLLLAAPEMEVGQT